jgi:hypothetical protein
VQRSLGDGTRVSEAASSTDAIVSGSEVSGPGDRRLSVSGSGWDHRRRVSQIGALGRPERYPSRLARSCGPNVSQAWPLDVVVPVTRILTQMQSTGEGRGSREEMFVAGEVGFNFKQPVPFGGPLGASFDPTSIWPADQPTARSESH